MSSRIAKLICRVLGHDWLLTAQGPGRGGVWHRTEACGRCKQLSGCTYFPYNAERFRR